MTRKSDVSVPPPSRRTSIVTRWRLIFAAAAVLATLIVIILHMQRVVKVEVVSPRFGEIESTVSATGTVIPTDDFPARATFAGIVDKIYVHIGEKVHAGQMLLQMRDQYAEARLANARAALMSAEVNDEHLLMNGSKEDRITAASDLERARSDQAVAAESLAAIQRLRRVGSASDSEVSAALQRLQGANAALSAAQLRSQSRYQPDDVKNAEAKIAADKASLEAERVSYANAYIASPVAGTVYLIPVNQYDFVQMGADLLHVANLNRISVRANIFEPDIKELRIGQPVRITWSGAPGRTWSGTIQSAPMAVTGDGPLRTGQCTIAVADNPGGLPVNTSVTVTASVEKHFHAITLPREAIHREGPDHYVYRVVDAHLEKTQVGIGLVTPSMVEITSGITSRDKVALWSDAGEKLRDKLRIKAAEDPPLMVTRGIN